MRLHDELCTIDRGSDRPRRTTCDHAAEHLREYLLPVGLTRELTRHRATTFCVIPERFALKDIHHRLRVDVWSEKREVRKGVERDIALLALRPLNHVSQFIIAYLFAYPPKAFTQKVRVKILRLHRTRPIVLQSFALMPVLVVVLVVLFFEEDVVRFLESLSSFTVKLLKLLEVYATL